MADEYRPGRWRPMKERSGTEWIFEDVEEAEKEAERIQKIADKVARDNEFTARLIEYLQERQAEREHILIKQDAIKEESGKQSLEYSSLVKVKELKLF